MSYFVRYFKIGDYYICTLLSGVKPYLSEDKNVVFHVDGVVEGTIKGQVNDKLVSKFVMSFDEVRRNKKISFDEIIEFNKIDETEFVKLMLRI